MTLGDSTVTRMPNGMTNNGQDSIFADLAFLDPTQAHVYFEDFNIFNASDFTITTTEAGGGSATEATNNEDGGVLLITNDNADDDSDFLQLGSPVNESFLFETGKKLFFKSRFKVSDATQIDLIMGLQVTDTTPLTPVDGVFFLKGDGTAVVDFLVQKNSVGTVTAATTISDDTYITAEFFYDGVSKVFFGIDGSIVGSSVVTNLPDDEELTVSFGIQNGEAVAKTMSIDYIFVAKER